MKNKNEYKKIVSSLVVLTMVITGFATMFIASPVTTVVAGGVGTTDLPSLRVYGEKDAAYPTHSYYDSYMPPSKISIDDGLAEDFIYKNETHVFDPSVIRKDSITFNAALYDHLVYDEFTNLNEKVFLRLFYEPEFGHNQDRKMTEAGLINGAPCSFNSIVTETTYMYVTTGDDRQPYAAKEGLCNDATTFLLPYDTTEDQPGLNVLDVHKPLTVECAVPDTTTNVLTNGRILLTRQFEIPSGSSQNFFDHEFQYLAYDEYHDKYNVKITYTGNDPTKEPSSIYYSGLLEYGYKPYNPDDAINYYFFNRHCAMKEYDDGPYHYSDNSFWPAYRWFVHIESVLNGHDTIVVTLGRWLVAGETFYVDGVRYDMPAICVENGDSQVNDAFKFITLQSPIPKYDDDNDKNIWQKDTTHVDTQWLEELPPGANNLFWLLPPFNTGHIMIDDIGIPKSDLCYNSAPYVKGLRVAEPVSSLDFYWEEEEIEPRFDSSLVERLFSTDDGDCEGWDWYGLNTMPNQYTSFVLPNQEKSYMYYDEAGVRSDIRTDGYEYLLTSSFIAPNTEQYTDYKASCEDRHDIVDRSYEIANPNDKEYSIYKEYYKDPRLVFEYDAENGKDIYINEEDKTVRIYGEPDANYPSHSYSDKFDYIYKTAEQVFDPAIIEKDSVTFNAAIWDGHVVYDEFTNLNEKIFLRMFYEPDYAHFADQKMNDAGYLNGMPCDFNAIVTETTYMYVTPETREPYAAVESYDGLSKTTFILPYDTTEAQPGLDIAGLTDPDPYVNVRYAIPDRETDVITNGEIIVEKLFTLTKDGGAQNFFDHAVEFKGYDSIHDKYKIKVTYTGNDPSKEPGSIYFEGGLEYGYDPKNAEDADNFYFFNRHCAVKEDDNNWPSLDNPAYRWYLHIESTGINEIEVILGRRMVAGETFYVDAVRYDMPAIYVTEGSTDSICDDRFKFITLQTPIPKYEDGWEYETTHVDTQWLEELPRGAGNYVWLLPPFNVYHTMIDDIDIPKVDLCVGNDATYYMKGLELKRDVGPLNFYWEDETIEPRFDTTLVERLFTKQIGAYSWSEWWDWFGVNTMPNQYTSFVLPDQEKFGAEYDETWLDSDVYADGNEYIITTSYFSPNTEKNVGEVDCEDRHEIIEPCTEEPRVAFEFDASNFEGIYINVYEQNHGPVAMNDPETDVCYEITCDVCGPCSSGMTCDPLTIPISELLSNDYDPDGDAISYVGLTSNGQQYGSAQKVGDNIVYTPYETDCDVSDYFEYTIQDIHGLTSTATVSICIICGDNGGPNAAVSYVSPSCVNEGVQFDASSSTGDIQTYKWDWNNDGTWDQTTSSPVVTHTWTSIGTKTFKLRVVEYDSDYDDVTKQIVIEDCTPSNCMDIYVQNVVIDPCCTGTTTISIGDATDVTAVHVRLIWNPSIITLVDYTKNGDWDWFTSGQVTTGSGYIEFEALKIAADLTGYKQLIELEFGPATGVTSGNCDLDIVESSSFVAIGQDEFCVDDNGDAKASVDDGSIDKGNVWKDGQGVLDWHDIIQMAEAIYEWGVEYPADMPDSAPHMEASLNFEEYDTYETGSANGRLDYHDIIELADMIYG